MKRGVQIHTLEGLMRAVRARRAVIIPKSVAWKKPIPAAFVINLQGYVLWQMFVTGMYLYEKGD